MSRKVRQQVLDRDGWVCRWHLRAGKIVKIHPMCSRRGCDKCAHVDHIVHWRDNPSLRDEPSNLIASCRRCNLTRGVGALPRHRAGGGLEVGAGGAGQGLRRQVPPPTSPALSGRLPQW